MRILFFLCLLFKISNKKSESYILIAKPETLIGCGGVLFSGEFFFMGDKDSAAKIGIILCPDGYGENFFKIDKKYQVIFSADSLPPKGYSSMSTFDTGSFYVPKRVITAIKKEN